MSQIELKDEYLDYVVSLQRQLMSVKDMAHEYKNRVEGLIHEKARYQEEVEEKNKYISRLEKLLNQTEERNVLTNNFMKEVTAKLEEPIKMLTSTVKEELSMSSSNLRTQSSYEDEMREEVRRLRRDLIQLKEENEELYAQLREIHETSPIHGQTSFHGQQIVMYGSNFLTPGWTSLPGSRSGSRSSCSYASDDKCPAESTPKERRSVSDAGHQVVTSTPVSDPSGHSSISGPSSGHCPSSTNWCSSFLPRRVRRRSDPSLTACSTPNLRAREVYDDTSIKTESRFRSVGVSCIIEESLKDEDLDRIWTLLPSGEDLDSASFERETTEPSVRNPWADGLKYKLSRRRSGIPSNTVMLNLVRLIDRFVIAREKKSMSKTEKIV